MACQQHSPANKRPFAMEKGLKLTPNVRLWVTGALAPYPSDDGNPFCSETLGPEEFLAERNIAESRNAHDCEWLHRPGAAVAFTAAAVRAGLHDLKARDNNDNNTMERCTSWLQTCPGFVEAIKALDVGNPDPADNRDVRSNMSSFVSGLRNIKAKDRKAFERLALRSARLYLLAMNLLEAMDLVRHPKLFAKKMKETNKEENISEEMAGWLKHPDDHKKLKEMLTKAWTKTVQRHRPDTLVPRRGCNGRVPSGKKRKRSHSHPERHVASPSTTTPTKHAKNRDEDGRRF